ncbi:MAG TPA: PepSY-associated TM helix domain-containing protein [Bryobacteraceae bacterium]|nr:PepSY-associated TM helix domain-containing protein [Bryobacteraceae bacterium]
MGFLQRYVHRPQQLAMRRLNFQVHLWVGLILTLYMILIGVTGSILVFRPELERLSGLKPWHNIQANGPVADIVTVVENLQAAYPRSHLVSVETPTGNDATFVAVLEGRGRLRVACGPKDGKILGEFPKGANWLDFIQELHESLLLRRTGRILNGAGAALLLLLNATGLVVWWPGIRNWKRAIQVDFQRNWRRINFDLHVSVGFWTILIASFWAVSGIYFGWPRQVFLFVNSLSPVVSARPPVIRITPESALPEFDLRSVIAHARTIDPGTTLGGIAFPYSRSAPLGVLMRRRDSPGYEYVDTVYFNPYGGGYISTWRYGVNHSLGDWIIWLQVPLHFGTYWGLGVKLVWAAAGLAIPLLAVTGVLMYWNRALRRKWKRFNQPKPRLAAA